MTWGAYVHCTVSGLGSDLPTKKMRFTMLFLFTFVLEQIIYSGLGFIVGSNVAALTGHWTWGVRVTAIFGTSFGQLELLGGQHIEPVLV